MKVETAYSLSSISLNSIVRARTTQSSIALPVESSATVYANLKHIRGIPAVGNSPGYSVSRLRALDNMIERLQGLKGLEFAREQEKEASLLAEMSDIEKMNENLIAELQNLLSNRIPGFLGNQELDTGLTLDITV